MPLEASQAIFRLLSSQKELKLCKALFTSRAPDLTAFEVRACAEIKILRFFFSRKFCCPLIFYLLRSLLSASFSFLSRFFFFCWAFTRLAFGGKRFCKKFKDRAFFFSRKYEWVVGQDFHWSKFLVKVTWFFASFSSLFR